MAGEKDLGNLTDNGIVGISISGTGNVGINTTTPTQLLDVTDNSGNCNIFCPEFSVYTILLIVTPKNRIVHNGNMNMSTRFCISARRASQSPHYVTRRTF